MKGMTRFIGLTVLLAATLGTSAIAQDCDNYHKRRCYGSENPYMRYNTQSKSGMFVLGHTSDLVFVAHAGQDYRISLCQDKKVEEPIKFQVIDSRSNEVLFDNQTANLDVPPAEGDDAENGGLPSYFEFTADATKKIIVRITAPGPPPEAGSDKKGRQEEPNPEDLFCVGVLLENMPTPKLGF
jgi:hypothetical protein